MCSRVNIAKASTLPLLLATALALTGCLPGRTLTSATDPKVAAALDAMRRDLCARAWRGVTTSRHDVLTAQTALEIAEDTAARAAYCGEAFGDGLPAK